MFYSETLLRTIAWLTEDYSLGCSLSDISKKLFQRDKGRARVYGSFYWKKKKQKQKHRVEHQNILLVTKETFQMND